MPSLCATPPCRLQEDWDALPRSSLGQLECSPLLHVNHPGPKGVSLQALLSPIGSEGLGSGMQEELTLVLFELQVQNCSQCEHKL